MNEDIAIMPYPKVMRNYDRCARRAACRARVTWSLQAQLRRLQLAARQAGRQAQSDGACGNALLTKHHGMLIASVDVAHPAA
jgi:hypothetical protein